jgi:NAD(P)-dependent dehydrogenase (short-subunit alcohol dehydrogenase family)
MAKTFAPKLRVNAIAPGLVLPGSDMADEAWTRLVEKTPAGRTVAIHELLLALDYLIENPAITGQTLTVDGGYSLV